ncbi:metal-dependent transcriptional regulator [Roseburia sp. OF03-24]|uniref:metal-dependent transcriptional regulator n=1 Tax=Roseburia sp. OF03-24 TaxID=2292367 RepID=UPI000E53E0EB|nr:metal-dependent transcriptional regulator [Roseburia sp. OF03-24]RGX94041.1 metal-dependent transcriptional regulator [Roseburia sp. OF03-24]
MTDKRKHEKEDYLKAMYLLKRRKDQVTRSDLERYFEASANKVNRVVDSLLEEGYLYRDDKRHIYLTAIGINKGKEYLEKYRILTEFLMMISGIDQQSAERNAKEIEYVIDGEVYMGIRMFLKKRHVFSYSMSGNDLNFLFPYGEREMPIAIYTKECRCPRTLAKEYKVFKKKVKVKICDESYLYLELEQKRNEPQVFYYYGEEWRVAKRQDGRYAILTEALECNVQRSDLISEGTVALIVQMKDEEPKEDDICILTVSLI